MNQKPIELPRDKSFGLFFAAVLAAVAGWFYYFDIQFVVPILGIAAVIFALSVFAPTRLRWLNYAWFQLGQVLGLLISPLILGVLYFGILTPVSLFCRVLGRDPLNIRSVTGRSNWKERKHRFVQRVDFDEQF